MLSLSHLYGKNRHRNKVRTLFLVDIFRMKDINAAYGFKNGDSVIKQLNKLLRDVIKNDVTREMADTFHIKMHHKITRHHSDVISISFIQALFWKNHVVIDSTSNLCRYC